MSVDTSKIARRSYPYLLLVPLALTPLFPRSLNAPIVTTTALLLGGLLLLLAAASRPNVITRGTVAACATWVVLGVWLAIAASWAATPLASLFLPHGAASYLMLGVWLVAGAIAADQRALRETLGALSAAGVFFSGAAMYEAIQYGTQRTQGYAAGFFENSASASELFAVALVAAATGALVSKNPRVRLAYVLAAVMTSVGILLTSSRTALLGLVITAIFVSIVAFVRSPRVSPSALAALPVLAAGLLSAMGVAAATGSIGVGLQQSLAAIGTDRDAIWRSAWAQIQRAPFIGRGPAQFSAVIDWGGLAQGQLTHNSTSDPHNLLLAVLLGGGLVGLALLAVAFAALLAETLRVARRGGGFGLALIASTPVLLLGMGLVGWLSEAALLASMSLLGAFLGAASARSKTEESGPAVSAEVIRAAAIALGIGALLGALAYARPISTMTEYARGALTDSPSLSPVGAVELYERFPMPGIATYALVSLAPQLQSGAPEARQLAVRVIETVEPAASRSTPLAVRAVAVSAVLAGTDSQFVELFDKQVSVGAEADPSSGLWFALAAVQAKQLGLDAQASSYAEEALRFPLDNDTRTLLESLAAK